MCRKNFNQADIDQHEVVALAALAENLDSPTDHVSTLQIKRDMEASGFTKVATTLALASLIQKGFLESGSYQDYNDEGYTAYTLTDRGWAWMLENKDKFVLEKPKDDIPF